MRQYFASGGQSIGVSASASVLPMNIQDWFPLGLTSLNSLLSKRLSRVFSNTIIWKHQLFCTQPSLWPNFPSIHVWTQHPYMTTGKTIALTVWTFVSKVMSLFLIRCLSLSWGFPCGSAVNNPPVKQKMQEAPGSVCGLGMRAWQSTPAFLPRESHGQKTLAGYSP